jgi:two-component system, OmpR family, copper resistance phosphate regulon response regulator CusR
VSKRILIAEDELQIASFIQHGLRRCGFDASIVSDGDSAYQHAVLGEHDLLVLDIGLPLADGFSVLRRIREAPCTIPVVILTARDNVQDTVAGLEQGADDYMAKPFQFDELLARIRRRLRDEDAEALELRCGGLVLDLKKHQVRTDDRCVDLTTREFALAETFFRNPGRVLERDRLLAAVWGGDHDKASGVLDAYVRLLRRKLGKQAIVTVRGKGYRMPS